MCVICAGCERPAARVGPPAVDHRASLPGEPALPLLSARPHHRARPTQVQHATP